MILTQDPDWSEGIEAGVAWLTDILIAYGSLEQRIQLRELPRGTLRYNLLFGTPQEAARFEAQLWALGAETVQVPFWPDGTPLLTAVEPPDIELELETATRRFIAGGQAMLWRDAENWEIVTIETVTEDGLTLASSVVGTWPGDGRTRVLPILSGRLEHAPELMRITSSVASMELRIVLDGQLAVAGDWAESYRGWDLLLDEPDRQQDLGARILRSLDHLDPGIGAYAMWDRAGMPLTGRQNLRLILEGREAIHRLEVFLARRRGRLVPFWWPTWNSDLQMSANLGASETELLIKDVGYAAGPFANAARRHLALIAGAEVIYCREVVDAAPGPPGIEILTLDAPTGVELIKDRTLISFLPLVRLAEDETRLLWHHSELAELILETQELPMELELEAGS